MSSAIDLLTKNTGETDLSSLMSNNAVFEIPFFQRPYKWTEKRLVPLHADVLALVDGLSDLHFLGAIITHGRDSASARPRPYEVIDGQQRLTTIYLHICAVVKTLIDHDDFDEASALFTTYLTTRNSFPGVPNISLHPSKEDRSDLNTVIQEILAHKGFGSRLPWFKFQPLSGTDSKNGRIIKNFKLIKKFYQEQIGPDADLDRLKTIYNALLNKVTVVEINVRDPVNGPKIFDSLNSRQEPMTVGDLVRNDVFSKTASSNAELAAELDTQHWQPFYRKFSVEEPKKKNYFDDYFFPYALIENHNLRKSDAYAHLRRLWINKDPKDVISDLAVYQDPFLDLVTGGNLSGHDKATAEKFATLRQLGVPASTYPFLMRLSRAITDGEIAPDQGRMVIDVIDSFLTRRAICGIEPTGLHAVFKRLWTDCDGEVSADNVMNRIADHKTVPWPGDADVVANVKTRPLYGTNIDKHLVLEYDDHLGGDRIRGNLWIEHVLPTSSAPGWTQFSTEQHRRMKDLFANLIPLSAEMNNNLRAKPYDLKRPVYQNDSMYKSARKFAEEHESWTPEALETRGEVLAQWCVERWPHRPERR